MLVRFVLLATSTVALFGADIQESTINFHQHMGLADAASYYVTGGNNGWVVGHTQDYTNDIVNGVQQGVLGNSLFPETTTTINTWRTTTPIIATVTGESNLHAST